MARTAKTETPFQRFQRLAGRIVRVPKEKVQKKNGDKPTPEPS